MRLRRRAVATSERGFQRRVGFGKKPAMINVDLANAWTRPGNPFTCENVDEQIIPSVRRLLDAFRRNKHLVVFATTCYQNTDRNDPHTDMGLWHHKIPLEAVPQNQPELWAIDDRIAPIDGEPIVIEKTCQRFSWNLPGGVSKSSRCRHHSGDRGYRLRLRASDRLRRPGRRFSALSQSRSASGIAYQARWNGIYSTSTRNSATSNLWNTVSSFSIGYETISAVKTYTYKQVDGLAIRANVYEPERSKAGSVVVWIHGGALIMGYRDGMIDELRTGLLDAGLRRRIY